MPKKPRKPRKPYLILSSVFVLLLASPLMADPKQGDKVLTFEYGYGSTQDVPGAPVKHGPCLETTLPCIQAIEHEESEDASLGASFQFYLEDDLSLRFRGWFPKGDPGMDTVSASLGLEYGFGHFYVPLSVGYWNDLDSIAFGAGAGFQFPIGKAVLGADAGLFYLDDDDLQDQTVWKGTAGVGFTF